jgi:pyruvate dehydrogenase E2 component (dihydrolipoamide acetyltransferase)
MLAQSEGFVVDVIMPKMGDAMTEGKILHWRKGPGDSVAKGEPIAEIETDKVNVDLEAEGGGVLLQIVVGEGETAEVGSTIAVIGEPGQKVEPRAQPAEGPERSRGTKAEPQPAAAGPERSRGAAKPDERVKASPVARKLAADHGLDLSAIRGTGPDGRITKEDVEAAAGRQPAAVPAAAGAEYEEQPLTKIRQTIAKRMLESKQQAPHFYVSVTVMMDDALGVRQQLNAGASDQRKISINDLVLRAAALALRAFPNLNTVLVNGRLRRHRRINLAVAIALPEGLIAPVIHDVDRKELAEIAEAAKSLGERARTGRLRGEDYEGGTFTVSNLGMYDVDSFVAIINPPHAAILAVGSAQPRAVVRNGQVTAATTMTLTISADHRITDGAEAARFLVEVKRFLENPVLLVTETTG